MAKNHPNEGNLYDKIFKENAESIFIPLVEEQLGIRIKKFRHLKEKMQTTLEREMDFLYEVLTEDDKKIILHLEFQSGNDSEMLFRIAEYHGMVLRRYRLPIYHVVIFLGTEQPTMRLALAPDEVFSNFNLINVHSLDVSRLLNSQVPEVLVLAVLANYPAEQSEAILRLLVRNLKAACKSPSKLSKYLNQLIILSRLRKLGELTIKITTEMPINYDVETDFLYLQGIEKGMEKGIEKGMEKG
ncbi:MAG: hypothetical protein SGI94_00875, partial [Saprospiraceae bacterium]|nr:hypothetical protein [Saprospiraceae bacterium]